MFTKAETHLISKTLIQRREWILKNINNPELATHLAQHQQTLEIIESVLSKLTPSTQEAATAGEKKPVSSIAQKRAQMTPTEIKVLVVDDDDFIASMMKVLLESCGIKSVHVAHDGLKAISMLYDANPVYDLVLCDWHMPIKSGLDVHNAMRAAERYMDTCFMLVTAVTEAKQIRAAIDEGVDDYIVKPIQEQKIIKKIARHFPQIIADNPATS